MTNRDAIRMLLFALLAVSGVASWVPASANTVTYLHTDVQGTVILETDQNRNVIQRFEYEPYGLPRQSMADTPGYTGHVHDAGSELVYMQQRYYDPEVGQFLSIDPVGVDVDSGANFNRYRYANNNPYTMVDPDGRQSCSTATDKPTCKEEPPRRQTPVEAIWNRQMRMTTSGALSPDNLQITPEQRRLGEDRDVPGFWNSRKVDSDDPVAPVALAILENDGMGALANFWIAMHDHYLSLNISPHEVSIALMDAHIAATDRATRTGGWLSALEVARYHHSVFDRFGIPRSAFGGTPSGSLYDVYFTQLMWCNGCRFP